MRDKRPIGKVGMCHCWTREMGIKSVSNDLKENVWGGQDLICAVA